MRTIINHSGRFILRREDFLAITGNDDCCSQLLSILEYWTACRLEEIDRVEAYNASAARGDGRLIKKMDLWLYERAEDFKQGILAGYGNETIKKALRKLESLGFICTKPSPQAWDRTKMYRLNIEAVQQAITNWMKSLKPLWERENENALGENENALGENKSGVSSYLNIQNINQNNQSTSPPTPPGEGAREGAAPVDVVEVEIVEPAQPPQNLNKSSCSQDQTKALGSQLVQSSGQSVPPPERVVKSLNNQIDIKTGKPYDPWMCLVDGRIDVDPDFFRFVIKENIHKPYFKDMKGPQMMRSLKSWIKNHHEEVVMLWEEFCNPGDAPEITVREMESQFKGDRVQQNLSKSGVDFQSVLDRVFNRNHL